MHGALYSEMPRVHESGETEVGSGLAGAGRRSEEMGLTGLGVNRHEVCLEQ